MKYGERRLKNLVRSGTSCEWPETKHQIRPHGSGFCQYLFMVRNRVLLHLTVNLFSQQVFDLK